jgi:hypothetical protein
MMSLWSTYTQDDRVKPIGGASLAQRPLRFADP